VVVRDRIELSTFRFSGANLPSRTVADRRLISHLPAPIVAGRRLASPSACPRWLPVWLPRSDRRRVVGLYIYSLADSAANGCGISTFNGIVEPLRPSLRGADADARRACARRPPGPRGRLRQCAGVHGCATPESQLRPGYFTMLWAYLPTRGLAWDFWMICIVT